MRATLPNCKSPLQIETQRDGGWDAPNSAKEVRRNDNRNQKFAEEQNYDYFPVISRVVVIRRNFKWSESSNKSAYTLIVKYGMQRMPQFIAVFTMRIAENAQLFLRLIRRN